MWSKQRPHFHFFYLASYTRFYKLHNPLWKLYSSLFHMGGYHEFTVFSWPYGNDGKVKPRSEGRYPGCEDSQPGYRPNTLEIKMSWAVQATEHSFFTSAAVWSLSNFFKGFPNFHWFNASTNYIHVVICKKCGILEYNNYNNYTGHLL